MNEKNKEEYVSGIARILGCFAGIIAVFVLAIVFYFFPSILLLPDWLLSLFAG